MDLRPTRWRRLKRWLSVAALLYATVVGLLVVFQERMIYVPFSAERAWLPPVDPRTRDVFLTSSAGDRIHAWWLPVEGADGAILFSHGNAGNLSFRGDLAYWWSRCLKQSVLVYDYPGFGKSSGTPSEAGCHAAAAAAYEWLTTDAQVPPGRVLLLGKSLGGAMAVELARSRPHRALVLVRPFTSIPDVAAGLFPWAPCRYLTRTGFRSIDAIEQCTGPVFVHGGRRDRLTPLAMSERLFAAAPGPKELDVDDSAHEDLIDGGLPARVADFLRRHAPD